MSYSTLPAPCSPAHIQITRYDPIIRTRGIHRHNPNGFTSFVAKKTASGARCWQREEAESRVKQWYNAAVEEVYSAGSRQQCMQQFVRNRCVALFGSCLRGGKAVDLLGSEWNSRPGCK